MKKFIFLLLVFTNAKGQVPCDHPRGVKSATDLLRIMEEKPVSISPSYFIEKCNVNDSIINRLRYLLNWQWTKNEVEIYYKKKLVTYEKIYQIEQISRQISKGNDSIYLATKDSIEVATKQNEFKYDKEYNNIFNVSEGIVLAIGWLNMKETIPFLRDSALNSKYYDKPSVELALARMGNKKLQKKIFNSCLNYSTNKEDFVSDFNNNYRKLIYIGTQESLFYIHEFIDTSKYFPINSEGAMTSFALKVVQNLKTVFGNDEINKLISQTGDEWNYNVKVILAIKQWIIKNKGKYIIKKWFCPY
jgi:hypothetical protein